MKEDEVCMVEPLYDSGDKREPMEINWRAKPCHDGGRCRCCCSMIRFQRLWRQNETLEEEW